MKKVINIAIFNKVFMKNNEKNEYFFNKKGVLVIEYEDFSKNIIDLSTKEDITFNDNIDVFAKNGKTKIKYLMESE